MDIYIMGRKVDYKIENEKTIKDIIESLSEIIGSYGHSITELRVDGKEFTVDDPVLANIDVANVNNLEIETASFFEISSSLIYSLVPYVQVLRNHVKNNSIDFYMFDQAKSWISDVLTTSLNMLFIFSKKSDLVEKRNELVKYILKFSYNDLNDEKMRKEFMNKLDDLESFLKMLTSVLDKVSESGNIFFDTTIDNDLSELLRLVDDIPIKLQLGKDKEALEEIREFSDLFINLVNFLDFSISSCGPMYDDIIEGFDFNKFEKVNEIIELIIGSISSKDFVSASDLITYELKPLIEGIVNSISLIRSRIFNQMAGN